MAEDNDFLNFVDFAHAASIMKEYDSFKLNRFRYYDPATTGYIYVFFTTPTLALDTTLLSGNPNADAIVEANKRFLKLPTDTHSSIYSNDMVEALSGKKSLFLKILSNRIRSAPAENIELESTEYGETYNRYRIMIGTTTKDSRVGGTIDIQFNEDNMLTITKMMKLWIDYIEGVYRGECYSKYAGIMNFATSQSASIDYMCSIYTFTTMADGATLLHWSKYTGCFPMTIPTGDFQSEDGDVNVIDKVNIKFQFAFKEDLDIAILRDFNAVATGGQLNNLKIDKFRGDYHSHAPVPKAAFDIGSDTQIYSPSVRQIKNDEGSGTPLYQLLISDENDPAKKLGMYPSTITPVNNYNPFKQPIV